VVLQPQTTSPNNANDQQAFDANKCMFEALFAAQQGAATTKLTLSEKEQQSEAEDAQIQYGLLFARIKEVVDPLNGLKKKSVVPGIPTPQFTAFLKTH
jgi:hypothetical protein